MFVPRRSWLVIALVVGCVLAGIVSIRQHVETSGDREMIAAHLQGLKRRLRQDPADKLALEEIRSVLNGRWSFARTYACTVIAELGPVARPAIPDLIEALNSGDDYVEGEAAIALGKVAVGDPAPVLALIKKLVPDDRAVAWSSAEALGSIGAPAIQAIPALENASQSANSNMASSAQIALILLKNRHGDGATDRKIER